MNAKQVFIRSAAAALFALGSAAQADTYSFSFTAGLFTGSGTFDVTGSTITSISGNVNLSPITGLTNWFGNDNRFSATEPYFSYDGLSFTTADLTKFNLYRGEGSYRLLDSGVGSIPDMPTRDTEVEVLSISAVPEPQTYALMLAGVAALSIVARRRKAA